MAYLFNEKLAGAPHIHQDNDVGEIIADLTCFPMLAQGENLPVVIDALLELLCLPIYASLQKQEHQRVIDIMRGA